MRHATIYMILGMVLLTLFFEREVVAQGSADVNWTIEPGEYDDQMIPRGNEFQNVKIELTSDIPVDIYVVKNDDLPAFTSSDYTTGYEDKYAGKTDFELQYEYPDQNLRYIVVVNPSSTDTANVVIENNLVIIGFDDDDTADNKSCGSYLGAGIVGLAFISAALMLIKKRQIQ